jgi:hypothetical protein
MGGCITSLSCRRLGESSLNTSLVLIPGRPGLDTSVSRLAAAFDKR